MPEYIYQDLINFSSISGEEEKEKGKEGNRYSSSTSERVFIVFKMYFISIATLISLTIFCCTPYLINNADASADQAITKISTPVLLLHKNGTLSSETRDNKTILNHKPSQSTTTITATSFTNKSSKLAANKEVESVNKSRIGEMKGRDGTMQIAVYNMTTGRRHQAHNNNSSRPTSLLFNSTDAKNATSKAAFGDQVSSSLFRPLFLKGLLGGQQKSSSGQPAEEEEEEVTQTIMMPMNGQQAMASQQQVSEGEDQTQADPSSSYATKSHGGSYAHHMQQLSPHHHAMAHREVQPKPEASFQLSKTEMNNLLNDKEAPEFYKEREVNGEGVLVGEEQPRLGTAASNIGAGGGGGYSMPGAAFEGADNFSPGGRLQQSSSEDYGSRGGFNHRFGHSFGSSDEFNPPMGTHSGRLMQSPAEFSEVNSASGFGEGRHFGPSSYGPGYDQGDFSPHSGMLKAGSNEYDGNEIGSSYDGAFDGRGMSAGGYHSPGLDRQNSELYGSGFNQGHFSGEFSSPGHGRLMGAGSNVPGSFGSSRMPFGADDEYSTRFGMGGGAGFGHQGFANQNNMMMRGNSMMTNSMQDTNGFRMREKASGGNKLMPLSPIIPVAEEVGSASNYREVSSDKSRDQFGVVGPRQVSQPQVHESLEDDPTSPADTGDDESSSGQYESNGAGVQGQETGDNLNGSVGDETIATTTASVHEMQARAAKGETGQQGPSLVLNVPPPNIDNSFSQPMRAGAEFSRLGSAGYLAPSMRSETSSLNSELTPGQSYKLKQRILKKANGFMSSSNGHMQQQQQREYDPAENPAHAGKYIID